jgi:hypothetical protein
MNRSTSPARRRTARTARGVGIAVRIAAPLGPIVALLLSMPGGGFHPELPGWHLVVVMLAGLGVDRLGLMLLDLGDHIERHRPAAS